jgi:hypothetical protein
LAILCPLSRAVIRPPEKLFRSLLQKGRSTERLNCRFKLKKRGQLFICVHNETLSVAAMRVGDPDRARIKREK